MKSLILLAQLLLLTLFSSCSAESHQPVAKFVVRDSDFKVIKIVDSNPELTEVEKLWNNSKKVSLEKQPNYTHKVDIVTASGSTRWLYDPNVYATVLAIKVTPVIYFDNPFKLKEMLMPDDSGDKSIQNEDHKKDG